MLPHAENPAVDPTPPPAPLTPLQREIARSIAAGWAAGRVAAHLGVAPATVVTETYALIRDLGLPGRTGLAVWAVQQGLLGQDRPSTERGRA